VEYLYDYVVHELKSECLHNEIQDVSQEICIWMFGMSKSSIEQIAVSNLTPDVQKLTRNLHLYDSTLTNYHESLFDYLKADELDCISERVSAISDLIRWNAFQYYSDQVKSVLDNDFFRIKEYIESVCDSVTKAGLKLLHDLEAEELARTISNSNSNSN
jgi:hypothetical protein